MIELSHVSKTYAPKLGRVTRAIDDVSFRVGAGEVGGIAGSAGSGKSTLLALVLGYIRPTTGSVLIDGMEPRRFIEREGAGYQPQRLAVPWGWRVLDALTRLSLLSGVRASDTRSRVDGVIKELGLAEYAHTRVRRLPDDGRVRFGLAQAVLADRRVIVLDEPIDGLNADSLGLLHDLVARLRAFDRSILIASRDTAELQRMTDRVTMLDRGRVRRVGPPRSTPANVETVFHLVMHHGGEHVISVFPSAVSLGRGTYAVRVNGIAALNRSLRDLIDRGALVASVNPAHAPADAAVSSVMTGAAS